MCCNNHSWFCIKNGRDAYVRLPRFDWYWLPFQNLDGSSKRRSGWISETYSTWALLYLTFSFSQKICARHQRAAMTSLISKILVFQGRTLFCVDQIYECKRHCQTAVVSILTGIAWFVISRAAFEITNHTIINHASSISVLSAKMAPALEKNCQAQRPWHDSMQDPWCILKIDMDKLRRHRWFWKLSFRNRNQASIFIIYFSEGGMCANQRDVF